MRAPQSRRLGGLRAHLAAAAAESAVEEDTAELVRSELLDDQQMAGFVRRGFHSFQLTDFDAEWHESVAADAEAASAAHPGDQQKIWAALAPKIDRVVKAPRFQGVLQSILGPDMMMVPQGHLHLATPAGQSEYTSTASFACDCYVFSDTLLVFSSVPQGRHGPRRPQQAHGGGHHHVLLDKDRAGDGADRHLTREPPVLRRSEWVLQQRGSD
eukprot:COSAG06_NODE_831_length_12041_cov_5.766789_8_plen_213_part_00